MTIPSFGIAGAHEEDEELSSVYPCPFCGKHFHVSNLSYHVENNHPPETRTVICALCDKRVMNLNDHITNHHEDILERQIKSTDLRDGDGCWQSISIGSTPENSTSTTTRDQWLTFLDCPAVPHERENLQPASSSNVRIEVDSKESVSASYVQQSLCDENRIIADQKRNEERIIKAHRSAFVQELCLSTILDPDL